VIVLDLYLPHGSGWDALAGLKKLQETRDIPVLVTSVAADESALERGAFASLTKPVARELLVRTLRRALGRGEE
jgi:CheY-like chemotaxis protein